MSVSNQPATIAYASDGASVAFAFPYYFAGLDDLVVTFKDSTGAVTTKVRGADYSVAGTLDSKLNVYSGGGTVTFGVAPANAGSVRITRRTPRSQQATYQPLDPFPAGTHEAALDRMMLILQEVLGSIGCVGVGDGPPTSGTFNNGDWIKNGNIAAGGFFGWIWDGGAWREFGAVTL